MKTTATVIVEACGNPPSSRTMIVKTIDASPRGPNQPTNVTLGRSSPEQRNGDRQHAYDCEAEDAIQGRSPAEIGEHRSHDDRAEDDEGHTVGQLAELVQEVGRLPHGVTLECAEYEAGDKRGDEAAASERCREPVGKRRGGCRQDLAPGRVHQAVPPRSLTTSAPMTPAIAPKRTP